ncbi:4Fe-4S binding protein [Leptolyngbya cf. ectocarpi LEGE 11479]|uniref:4Fe-4S binding protein n=1 Tax=Leptolyngbya cf. ectocarpi LEGE 11479 TaxID=1828722 RepID=A0A928ZST5_LEPEC|nr:4Fe-4S binding protein [Leptolyngbya ectocarpi]MBE9065756.1 4Fe-4S binding protein [Leptolyngbya cf. ectocarpi LEGE 11479]
MISKISERQLHAVRWILVIGWGVLILSLFYDPVSHGLTDPNSAWGLLGDRTLLVAQDPSQCVKVQGECVPLKPYAIGARIFWGMIVPCGIFIVFVFGHETWRRICPLYFFSQIPRALGLSPRSSIKAFPWLEKNHFYLQFGLFFLGLNGRILLVNSVRPILGTFLILTLLASAGVVWLLGGRSWCHYVCPFGMVQTVFTGPRGLLDSQAHTAMPKGVTQSMCRTVEPTGTEKSACISCKSPCMDIDSEKAYWEHLQQPGRRLIQYGYLGLVVGYFLYYWLYAGNFDYYFSGVWSHESAALANLWKPGFYWFGTALPIPKLVTSPLTLGWFAIAAVYLGTHLEKRYRGHLKYHFPHLGREQSQHRLFSICTFLAFNIFFIYGGRPEINSWPLLLQFTFQAVVALVSGIWLYRTWDRSPEQYMRESVADKLKRQLAKLSPELLTPLIAGSIDQLSADEIYVLAKTLPHTAQYDRAKLYKGVLQEALEAEQVTSANSLMRLHYLQEQLEITPQQHYDLLAEVNTGSGTQQLIHPIAPPLPRTLLKQGSEQQRTVIRREKDSG